MPAAVAADGVKMSPIFWPHSGSSTPTTAHSPISPCASSTCCVNILVDALCLYNVWSAKRLNWSIVTRAHDLRHTRSTSSAETLYPPDLMMSTEARPRILPTAAIFSADYYGKGSSGITSKDTES